ncbi:hydrolase [Hyphodiscus hymeniophilus]|uniref:Hydrolase n=1 Tax=Hyphodiscus hymeniophilus TaxID=353542 RepID=A0A9P6VJZ0_9HELO|nr:hydrolase [Hyphodiscus hymeniophilus]
MKILCLHGRGSNNEVYCPYHLLKHLLDYADTWLPGNWSLYTTEFSTSKLWGYYKPLDPEDTLSAEQDILDIVKEEGPFDGILGYSQGATLAAQVILRHTQQYPFAAHSERPFRFAIFINAGTPAKITPLTEEVKDVSSSELPAEDAMLYSQLGKNNPNIRLAQYSNGRYIVTDGSFAMTKWDAVWDGTVINFPTLHVRCPDDFKAYGEELYKLCHPDLAQQVLHSHGHDFPRGYSEMRDIARLIKVTAETVPY